mgnify:CR=1 FL=1
MVFVKYEPLRTLTHYIGRKNDAVVAIPAEGIHNGIPSAVLTFNHKSV